MTLISSFQGDIIIYTHQTLTNTLAHATVEARNLKKRLSSTPKPREKKTSINRPRPIFQLFGVYSHIRPCFDIGSKPALYQPSSPLKGAPDSEGLGPARGRRRWRWPRCSATLRTPPGLAVSHRPKIEGPFSLGNPCSKDQGLPDLWKPSCFLEGPNTNMIFHT